MLSYVNRDQWTKITNLLTDFRQYFHARTVYLDVKISIFMSDTRWIE